MSSYGKLYNWLWFFSGYHAEHHFRPKVHWTQMEALRAQIIELQRAAGVRVIKPPHALGFLDADLPDPKRKRQQSCDVPLLGAVSTTCPSPSKCPD